MSSKKDRFYLNLALNLAKNMEGLTGTNPSVGSILVKKDEVICKLDDENRTAALNEAEASKNKAQLQYDAIKTLADEGYRSENAVATADAALKASIARVEMAMNELDNILHETIKEHGFNSIKDLGKLLGFLKSKYPGQLDMQTVAEKAKTIFND